MPIIHLKPLCGKSGQRCTICKRGFVPIDANGHRLQPFCDECLEALSIVVNATKTLVKENEEDVSKDIRVYLNDNMVKNDRN